MGETIRTEIDGDARYWIVRTDNGVLVTMRTKDAIGLQLPCEWLYRHEETAQAGLDSIMALHALWRGMTLGYDTRALEAKIATLNERHREIIERLGDRPLMGTEVREVRQSEAPDDD